MKFRIIEVHPPKNKKNEERMYEKLGELCERIYKKYIENSEDK